MNVIIKLAGEKVWRMSVMFLLAWGCGHIPMALGGVMLNGTRIVLDAGERNTSTVVSNVTSKDYAVQVWVNDKADSNATLAPFIAMPALFRVRAGEEQVVRIIKTPGLLPEDRESVFYFNAQEIPLADKNGDNSLKVAIRTRVKFFYRPEHLKPTAALAPAMLQWKLIRQASGDVLRVTNPSPYHITFSEIRILRTDRSIELSDPEMIAPLSTRDYAVGAKLNSSSVGIEFSTINDYGGYSDLLNVKADI